MLLLPSHRRGEFEGPKKRKVDQDSVDNLDSECATVRDREGGPVGGRRVSVSVRIDEDCRRHSLTELDVSFGSVDEV